jgi:4-diphosphocytidyl-2-C-methyl-D-erythritol kinase
MPPLLLRAPAKINLTLEVLARREDGYHSIRSVMVPISLSDEIEVSPADEFAFHCSDPGLRGEHNLALRALRAIEQAAVEPLRASVALRKRIPLQAGLGGGSSDAATLLLAAAAGCFGRIHVADWLEMARALGSDVPFFLAQTGALVEGTGERVTALGALSEWAVVIVKPPSSISTAHAYATIVRQQRQIRPRKGSISLRCAEALQRGNFDAVESLLHNDFYEIAMNDPAVRQAAQALRDAGATHPLLAGSGSAVFALARDVEARDRIIAALHLPAEFVVFPAAFVAGDVWNREEG